MRLSSLFLLIDDPCKRNISGDFPAKYRRELVLR
jgi:hypothetical protein